MNILSALWLVLVLAAATSAGELREGATFQIGDKTAIVSRVVQLPFVTNDYSRRFKFDSAANPKLRELRERYRLEEVVAAGRDEFERQILLMDWVHNRFQKFGRPSTEAKGALQILSAIDAGHTFFCTQYAQLFASASASLGWMDRVLALRRHQDSARASSSEHSTTEIWSNQHRKWVMLDPTSNMYLEKGGIPLSAYEIRQEWFYNGGKEIVFVIGKERRRSRKADLPIFLKHFVGFGDLKIDPDELDKYGFIGYVPNTDLMDSGFDYGQMFIVKDQLCAGTQWHKRDNPADPASEPYFPLNQVAFAARSIDPNSGALRMEFETFTPNLKELQVKFNEGEWQRSETTFEWQLAPGRNRLQARTVNQFGVPGPISTLEFEVR